MTLKTPKSRHKSWTRKAGKERVPPRVCLDCGTRAADGEARCEGCGGVVARRDAPGRPRR